MTPDHEVRFTVIGMGNLMEVIWHCLEGAFGGPDLAGRAVTTTADAADLERKAAAFGVPVRLHGNLDALRENRPDIVFFAPPPAVAPRLIDDDLKPYFEEARQRAWPLPDLYAFPPLPAGHRYREVLGRDVNVVNIIPNNVSRVAGVPVRDEGYYVCTYPAPWPEENRHRLQRVFAAQGACVEVPPDGLVPMLGGTCTIFSLWRVVPAAAEALRDRGHPVHHNAAGGFCRARVQALTGFRPADSVPADADGVSGPPAALLSALIEGWFEGVRGFFEDIAFPEAAGRTILARGFDVILHTTQREPVDVLEAHAVGAATRGGVLEKAIATFEADIRPMIREGVPGPAGRVPDHWGRSVEAAVRRMAHAVKDHGTTLAG